jgi:hypothetical protein
MSPSPLPSPLPIKPAPTAREPEDIEGIVLLWQSPKPEDREKALEWADRNRVNARSTQK